MTAPQDAPAGPVLEDPALQQLFEAVADARVEWSHTVNPDMSGAAFMTTRLAPVVAALLSSAREEGARTARRDAVTRLEGFGVDPAVVEHFRSLVSS